MINRAKKAPIAGTISFSRENPFFALGKLPKAHAPLARTLLTIAVVAVSIALAMLMG
jgi:hypothetical protein